MEFKDLRNESGLEFTDISSEEFRNYIFISKDGSLTHVKINNPIAFNVSKAGDHRLIDSNEISYYIPSGWIMITWKTKEDKPHFVK